MAKYIDKNGLQTIWDKIKATFVAKETGKGLSTNDYTTTEKTKLGGIATGAQVNVIESIKVNNTAQAVDNKAVNITVPTNLSELNNDSAYQTKTQLDSAVSTLNQSISNVNAKIPSKVSQLTNDSNFQTKTQVDTAIQNLSILTLTVDDVDRICQ